MALLISLLAQHSAISEPTLHILETTSFCIFLNCCDVAFLLFHVLYGIHLVIQRGKKN